MNKLDDLYELYCARDLAQIEKRQLIDFAIPPEVKQSIKDIEAECLYSASSKSLNASQPLKRRLKRKPSRREKR